MHINLSDKEVDNLKNYINGLSVPGKIDDLEVLISFHKGQLTTMMRAGVVMDTDTQHIFTVKQEDLTDYDNL